MFIEVHDKSGSVVYVNSAHVLTIETHGNHGCISLSDGTSMIVKENIHEVMYRIDHERSDLV